MTGVQTCALPIWRQRQGSQRSKKLGAEEAASDELRRCFGKAQECGGNEEEGDEDGKGEEGARAPPLPLFPPTYSPWAAKLRGRDVGSGD